MAAVRFIVTKHMSEGRLVLAVCDSDIHGRKFKDENAVLDLGSKFYNGEEKDAEQTANLMEKAYIINAVGEGAVEIAIKLRLTAKENVKDVSGVPHVQVLML